MKTKTIEELAYFLKEAKDNNAPAPIFFLGAGASDTGGIPLAGKIIEDILRDHCDNPSIKKLKEKEQTYAKLMECLSPSTRNTLLKGYIDQAKINVSHIYLAQFMMHGFADYVLTVNFDNLMLRALALFNEFPSTYDMAILKDMTTTSFKKRSVVYLHGQHHGLWLLNTQEEMAKVKEVIPPILNQITNERPWIFIGYSGDDPIFEHIEKLGRFDNGLYWVGYKDHEPNKKVKYLLEKPNTNAFLIKDYDADSFMLKLNSELGLPQPEIVDKPFTSLKNSLNEIVDIDDEDHFKGVKERLEIARNNVDEAIQQFEQKESKADELHKRIISLLVNDDYPEDKIKQIERDVQKTHTPEINDSLASLYFNWGNALYSMAITKSGAEAEPLFQQTCNKYQKATELKTDYHEAYYNWGNTLVDLAKSKSGDEADSLFRQAGNKYQKATEIKADKYEAYNNWGNVLGNLAVTKSGDEAESLSQQAFDKYQKTIEANVDDHEAYYNWGNSLFYLATIKSGDEMDSLFQQAGNKFQKATEVKSDNYEAYNNWGNALYHLAVIKSGDEAEPLFQQAFEKYQKAIKIKADFYEVYYNWGNALAGHAKNKSGDEGELLFQQAFKKLKKAVALGSGVYSLACLYAQTNNKEKALQYLEDSFKNKEITADSVKEDDGWSGYGDDNAFNDLLKRYA